jgi:hypothetical protein
VSYRVDWNRWAEDDLAAIWAAATDRGAVTAAAARLDDHLARDPLRFGEPWGSSVHRIASEGIIGVEYEVFVDDMRVLVHSVFTTG